MSMKAICIGAGAGDAGRANDANALASLATDMGYDTTPIVDSEDYTVTKQEVLDALTTLVTTAEPGDDLFFSLSAYAHQSGPNESGNSAWSEADGKNEVLELPGGNITDDEIIAILKQLPADANLTLAMDTDHAAGIADLDLGHYIPGNVVCLTAMSEGQSDSAGNGDAVPTDLGSGTFSELLAQVVRENPGISWAEAATKVDELNGDLNCNATANDANLLTKPAFNFATEEQETQEDGAAVDTELTERCLPEEETATSSQTVSQYVDDDGNLVTVTTTTDDHFVTSHTMVQDHDGNVISEMSAQAPVEPEPLPLPIVAECLPPAPVEDDCCC